MVTMLSRRATLSLRPYEPSHVVSLLTDHDPYAELLRLRLSQAERLGPAFTAFLDETPIAAGGIVILWPGVAEAWTILTDSMRAFPLWLTRTVNAQIDPLMTALHLHRLQTNVATASERNLRWVEALGFQWEGTMPGFFPDGESGERYAMVRRHG